MERYYCEKCQRLFEIAGICDGCHLPVEQKIVFHKYFQTKIKKEEE
ncbi:hypothetical protein [Bacillus pakistanensis]|nr:hypothetical protein [Bacillus pakistanensis]